MQHQTRSSSEFLSGLALHLELGGKIDQETIPAILEAIEHVDNPNGKVGEIKGLLETVQEAGHSARLTRFTNDKIASVLGRDDLKEKEYDGPVAMC